MWISKKKYKALEKRIADLEVRAQGQQKKLQLEDTGITITTFLSDSTLYRTEVSFQVTSRDWYKLKSLREWKDFEKLLQEYQNKNSLKQSQVVEDEQEVATCSRIYVP